MRNTVTKHTDIATASMEVIEAAAGRADVGDGWVVDVEANG